MGKNSQDPIIKLRRVVKCGSSFYISMPKEFVKKHGIERGEKLPVLANHILKVVPMKEK